MARDKQAALQASNLFDKTATYVQRNAAALGINPNAAQKLAFLLDRFADHVERGAGIDPKAKHRQADGFDPEEIGEEVGGPKEQDGDESYMNQEFTQQERRELRERQQGGELGSATTTTVPQTPRPGVQAALMTGSKLAQVYIDINNAASRLAASNNRHVRMLGTKLAGMGLDVLQFQTRVLEGSESGERAQALLRAAAHVVPHLAGDVTGEAAVKLAHMSEIMAGLAKAA